MGLERQKVRPFLSIFRLNRLENIGFRQALHGAIESGADRKSAQIDLIIDRSDQVINLCEMKYSLREFEISKDYANRGCGQNPGLVKHRMVNIIKIKQSVIIKQSGTVKCYKREQKASYTKRLRGGINYDRHAGNL